MLNEREWAEESVAKLRGERELLAERIVKIDSLVSAIHAVFPESPLQAPGPAPIARPSPVLEKPAPIPEARKGPWGRGRKLPPTHVPPQEAGKLGEHACPVCGREGLQKQRGGGGGVMLYHVAPCGLPCNGANLDRLTPSERENGTHSKRNCPKCKVQVSA